MTKASIKCPGGHPNPAEQKFCGACGVSLAGVCPSGHPNPEGQLYCGECGSPVTGSVPGIGSRDVQSASDGGKQPEPPGVPTSMSQSAGSASGRESRLVQDDSARPPLRDARAGELRSPPPPSVREDASAPSGKAHAAIRPLRIGDELQLPDGVAAVVVKLDDDTAWLNITQGETSHGISTFPRRDVEKAVANRATGVNHRPTPVIGTRADGSPRAGAGSRSFWAALPLWGQAAVGVLGAILLVILIVIVDMVAGATAPWGGVWTRSSLDDVFLQKLEGFPVVAGVWDTNPSEAIEIAKQGCELSESGYRQNQIISRLTNEYSDKSPSVVATTIGVGAMVYCPAALDRP